MNVMKRQNNDNPLPQELYEFMSHYFPTGYGEQGWGQHDLHHCIVDKGDIRGLPLAERRKIHDARNLWWVLSEDHASHANILTKQEYYRLLCDRWGMESVDQFILSFNWKIKPPFTLEWLKGE